MRMMGKVLEVVGLVMVAVLAGAVVVRAQQRDDLVYKMTIRSFMQVGCMNSTLLSSCLYQNDIIAGKIGGHPDFELDYSGALVRKFLVNKDAVKASSGLFKPVLNNSVNLCTVPSAKGCDDMSGPEYFKAWYNDDPFYNKRIGTTLNLINTECQSATVCKFVYDSNDETDNFFGPLDQFLPEYKFNSASLPTDYRLTPIWPQTSPETGGGIPTNVKFWFTTEIHSFFTLTGPGDEFKFSGDDDVWLFVNGKLALDLGGIHSRAEQTVNMWNKRVELGLVQNGTYTFDLFHAERHTVKSNALVQTTLTEACNVRLSGTTSFDQSVAVAGDFVLGRGSSFNGVDASIVLTESSSGFRYDSTFAYLAERQNVGTGFRASFDVEFTGTNEGFAFVMHRRPNGLTNLPPSLGSNLGFLFLTHSLVVAFDLCADRSTTGLCEERSVSIHYPSNLTDYNEGSDVTRIVNDTLRLRPDITTHNILIEYFGEDPNWLEVTIDNSLFLRVQDLNIRDKLGGRDAFLGFTSAVVEDSGDIAIRNLLVETVTVNENQTIIVDVPEEDRNFGYANGIGASDGLTVQTRDFCENEITSGGFGDAFKGFFVEQPDVNGTYFNGSTSPNVFPAESVDNQDGTYTLQLSTTVPGNYDLVACFGNCWLEVQFTASPGRRRLEVANVEPTPNSTSTAIFRVTNATTILEETLAPTFAPTAFLTSPPPSNEDTVKFAAIGGGAAFAVFLCMAAFLCVFRSRWQRDKQFIEDGQVYRMNRDVRWNGDDEYSKVGKDLLQTRSEILRVRAEKTVQPKEEEINHLMTEKEELQEQLRVEKMRSQQQQEQTPQARFAGSGASSKKKTKKTFELASPQV